MGYYNNHMDDENKRSKKNRQRTGMAGFIGAVIGALLVVFSMPLLSGAGLLPGSAGGQEDSSVTSENDSSEDDIFTEQQQNVNLSVNSDITEAVNNVSDAVVGVFNLQRSEFWQEEEGGQNQGTGSGVIYKVEGDSAFIVTNHHVIEGASQVEVSLSDEQRVEAELVGSDVLTDLAVLQIDAEGVDTVAEFGNSENLNVGEPAIAIGNPLGTNLSRTVTQGIISATERSIPVDLTGNGQPDWNAEVMQTDAAINPGNSGGALINISGQLIGINSMKIAQSTVEGIGFAIPSAVAIPVIEDLETKGEVERPQMGIGIRSLSEIPSYHWQETLKLPSDIDSGVFVTNVAQGTPAQEAGLQEYDVITSVDGEEITDGHDLRKYLYTEAEIGNTIEITFYREGEQQTTELTLNAQQDF
ncbi:S1C family serine protease [Alteribacillus bidgolensis]|uniref:HtrA-like peptidase. Serine peptidase. MEROPS family S01B n=1 Tax=Alteribacillus bidgolensis TaxID=930129 RepID=A0A1G8LSQ7_9BACI|nr:S1C family serine protease [Alteribacillus bidgolensis]SDI58732.1 htrA-like peptidase. Serine peptidase. MEROPS family S01B [Alteribacillus bidgolensis]